MNTQEASGTLMKRKQCKRRGFSVVEFEIGLGICVIALSGILGLVHQSLGMKNLSNDRVVAMDDTRRVMEQVRHEIERNGVPTTVALGATQDWSQHILNGPNNTTRLTNETVTVLSQNDGNDPLHVRVRINWEDQGKPAQFEVNSIMTQRGAVVRGAN
jgi:Tfp pilus assembly protein PilW